MRARHTIFAAIAMVGAAALAAPAFAEDLVRVGNPAGDDFHFSFANVGESAGIFKANGTQLQITALAGGAKLHQAMVAGSLDIALGAGTDFGLLVKGAPEKGVGVLATVPSNIVIQASKLSGVTTVTGLKGKKVAVSSVGSLTYWMARKLSQHEGWGLDGMQLVATGGGQANVAGFETGSLDAAVTSLEAALRVEQAGQGKVLLSFGEIVNPFIAHVIYATDAMIAQHPDTLRRFLKGWYETVAWAKTHKAETIKYSQPETLLNDDLASKVYDVEIPTFSLDGRFDPNGVAAVDQALLDLGTVKEKPADKAMFTEAFLPSSK